jgi:Zn-dependent protease
MPTRQGSIHLFRFAGVDLFLHWSWFLVAVVEISARSRAYSSVLWNVLEYLALFLIVMFHEYGHALACRQVGGVANQIVLWPLGGVAYVDPPLRPGATLWSIAAGPLVNVVLLPLLTIVSFIGRSSGWWAVMPNAHLFVRAIWFINFGLLIFNLLPIYPLDGGQILRSLLWFVMGRARSLMVATVIGLVGAAGLISLAVWNRSLWLGVLSLFIVTNCWSGMRQAQVLVRIGKLPRREGFACPNCESAPPIGEFWKCPSCNEPFDTFLTQARCPKCGEQFSTSSCVECRHPSPIVEWINGSLVGARAISEPR